jgi:hypothetical protein
MHSQLSKTYYNRSDALAIAQLRRCANEAHQAGYHLDEVEQSNATLLPRPDARLLSDQHQFRATGKEDYEAGNLFERIGR